MVVILSDLHLSDNTAAETLHDGAFEKFSQIIDDMVIAAHATEVDIVFLGDIFDVLRSNYWQETSIRPWSATEETDNHEKGLQECCIDIMNRIVSEGQNQKTHLHLRSLKEKLANRRVHVRYRYCSGNHDWLVNRFEATRVIASEFLCLDEPQNAGKEPFQTSIFFKEYSLFARHGDTYDPLNCHGADCIASFGDVFVVELINKFPQLVEEAISTENEPMLISFLREIDNVRPLWDVPIWIHGSCCLASDQAVERQVNSIWADAVDSFLKLDIIKHIEDASLFNPIKFMRFALTLSKQAHMVSKLVSAIGVPLFRLIQQEQNSYCKKAYSEQLALQNMAEYIVYGHTHQFTIQPLDTMRANGSVLQKIYFNTGTWRKVHSKALYSRTDDFLSWNCMTFIAFYGGAEREKKRRFEIWNGILK
ncbi:MAG: metallophosphoesterase [Chitinivibrionales bacterium]|nr:metallophosphoesterase [Chitinivibrionales bacterium]